jgi:N-acetylmuramoyl-L-alanine amidase
MALLSFEGSPHGGRQRHLPEWQSQPKIKPTTIIDHSIVGSAEGAFRMFRDSSSLESHFIVDLDGEIWQLMDTNREADANLHANAYAISIETADRGDPDTQPWTPEQLNSLVWLHERLLETHPGIPRRRSRSCADPAGLGYHTLHGAPSCWTPVSKTCPGTVRKRQWAEVLLPAFLNPEETDMPLDDDDRKFLLDELERLAQFITTKHNARYNATKMGWVASSVTLDKLHADLVVQGTTGLADTVEDFATRQRLILAKLEEIQAALPDPLAEPPPAP